MQNLLNNIQTNFISLFKKQIEECNFSKEMLQIKQDAIERFKTIGLPQKKDERFTYVPIQNFISRTFTVNSSKILPNENELKKQIYKGCEKNIIILVDGKFAKKLSNFNKSVSVAQSINSEAPNKPIPYNSNDIKNENDPFVILNNAFMDEALVININSDNFEKTIPLQILHILTNSESPILVSPKISISIKGKNLVELLVKITGAHENTFFNGVQNISLQHGSNARFTLIQEDLKNSCCLLNSKISLYGKNKFSIYNYNTGAGLLRNNFEVFLSGKKSEFELNTLSILSGIKQAHNYVQVHHRLPECKSTQIMKNIIKDNGRASVDTTVIAYKNAELTESGQLVNNLLLSNNGKVDVKPNLKIFADDVKCSHGSTVGQINDEQLFYLQTRGIKQSLAKNLLIKSFGKSIIDKIPYTPVREEIDKNFQKII